MATLERFINDYPFTAGVSFFIVVSMLVGALFAAMMRRAGVSLRPLVFFFGFIAIIAGPQAIVYLLNDYLAAAARREVSAVSADAEPASATPARATLRPIDWAVVFGPGADPSLITDARRGLEAILSTASDARLSFRSDGGSALAARFDSADEARAALNAYGTFFQFADATGSDATGWTARRFQGQGEWNHVVVAGNELYAWTGATREAVLAERVRALGVIAETVADALPSSTTVDTQPAANWLRQRPRLMATFLCINVLLAVGWFFKGSAWATRIAARRGVRAVDAMTLRQRLLALNSVAEPIAVTTGGNGDVQIDWRYGDAQWFDLMRVHAMRRAHRLVLRLDPDDRTVRVREFWSAFDGSAGAKGANLQWHAAAGMQFFHVEHQRDFGVQLDERGRPTGGLSKAYTFDLQALKRPVIEAVTDAGWTWQPVMLAAPPGLRWLME